jgi:hypothetical protein
VSRERSERDDGSRSAERSEATGFRNARVLAAGALEAFAGVRETVTYGRVAGALEAFAADPRSVIYK